MVRQQQDLGGLMSAEDLAAFEARFETPCRVGFGDVDVYGCGPWSQGPLVLQALSQLDGIDLAAMGHNSADYVHTVTEAMKLAAADREAYFGDPDFVNVPMDRLLAQDYTAARRKMIRPDEAWPEMPPFGTLPGFDLPAWRPDPSSRPHDGAPVAETLETSHLCVADRQGNLFASTPSDPTISGPVTPGTGITPSMWGSRAYTDPRHPAAVGPGRRPRMSANPMIAVRDGRSVASFGSPGSEVLGQAQLQAFLNIHVFGMDPQAAVEAPRFASYSWPASAIPHSYHPGRLNLEADIGEAVGADLSARGHKIDWWPPRKWSAGSVCSVGIDLESGLRYGAADPRRTAYAVGW
jgi:gamma-glutamyltranspeptidase/glutathione hydrolase